MPDLKPEHPIPGHSRNDRSIIIAGGGTGGHVLAGVAIADAWRERFNGQNPRIDFVGAEGGIEEKLVPRAGYTLHKLRLGSLKGVSIGRRLKTLTQLPLSLLRSAALLISIRPGAVVGVGGYASGPLVLMARLIGWCWGARVAILEQNAVPGFTNRILSRFVHQVLSAFPGIEERFPAGKVKVTGNPVRAAIHPEASATRDPFVIFIFGGSQGAQGINTMVLEALTPLRDLLPRLKFIHQTGERDHERVKAGHAAAGTDARVEKFIHDMPDCYRVASLVVGRAGSSTLAEIAAVGRASVLIPFPYASDNHQEKNAQVFVDGGAARLLVQFKSNGEDLARIIRELMASPERLDAMERASRAFYRPDAARAVVQNLLS